MSAIGARFKHLSLRQRFLIAPLLGCLLLVLLLAAFVYESQRQNSLLNDIAKHRLSAVDRYSEVFADLATQHIALHELLSRTGGLDEESFYVQAKARLNAIHAAIGGIEQILRADPPARREAAAVLALHRDLAGLMEEYRRTVTAAVEIKTVNLAIATSMRANQRFSAMSAAFSRLLKYQRGGLESDIADGVEHSRASAMALSAGALLGAILLLFLSMGLSRMLSRSLDQQIQTLVEIGGGEAGDDLERDEVGRIGRAIDSFKRTQLALRESEQRFRLFFERNDVIMLLIDPDSGAIQDANQAAARFYGHVRARLRRMDMRDIEAEAGLAPGCAGHPTILRHRLADGALRYVEVSATPVEAAGKTLLFSIVHDITERRRAEEQLRLLNQELERRIEERTLALWSEKSLLRSIIDTLPDMISVKNHAGAYLACNRTFARGVIGLAESEVVGRRAAELQAAEPVALLRGLELRVLATGATHREERWVALVDGRRALMESVIAPLHDYDGKITGTVEIGHDITERNQREEALREARLAADAANRAKSAFLATMSHEIRTPINGVIGMVEVLAQSRLSEHQSDALKTVRDSAFLLLSVIDDILDFSKIEAGRMELERVQVSITEIVEGICNSLLPVASAKGVDLTLFISPLVPAQVWSDPTRLRQVLYNLMGNAIKFSGGRAGLRGRVAVRVEPAEGDPRRLQFRIADNGIGMSAETQANLFTPFTQGEVSTIRRFGGTGLGLVISQRLLNLMQGETRIDSALGVGTTFTVTLPVEAVDGAAEPGLPELGGLDCIIVAGSLFDPGDLRVYLEHAGARVRDAADLAAAARCAADLAAPVVLWDIGFEAVSAEMLHAAFAGAPQARFLLIARGRRRHTRMLAADAVMLDGDGLRRAALLFAVARAAGRLSSLEDEADAAPAPACAAAAPPSVAAARALGQLILVAEDDEINQKVILQQLGLLGYAAEIAADGREALRLWRGGRYAMLLTDLHMPEMDGYTLTETIRREEGEGRHMPILALTANALRGEANRARAVGIDDYLTKPIRLSLLRATLDQWLPRGAAAALAAAAAPEPEPEPEPAAALDLAVLSGLVGDDPEVLREFLSDYRAAARRQAQELRAAAGAGDTRQVGAICHKLKSSSRSVGALALGDLCAGLECAGLAADKALIGQDLPKFEAALAAVEALVADLLSETLHAPGENHP